MFYLLATRYTNKKKNKTIKKIKKKKKLSGKKKETKGKKEKERGKKKKKKKEVEWDKKLYICKDVKLRRNERRKKETFLTACCVDGKTMRRNELQASFWKQFR